MRSHHALLCILLLAGCPGTDGTLTNSPPSLALDVGTTIDYVVGEGVIRITATGTDPDGDALEIGVAEMPPRADLQDYDGFSVFSWDPLASDVTLPAEPKKLIFFAEDSSGERTEKTVNVNIRAGNGIPVFTSSPSYNHTVGTAGPIQFNVTVRDDDSQRVALTMLNDRSPIGAEFRINGDKSGQFRWEPTEQQLEQRVHTAIFLANDGVNAPVEQRVSILLTKQGQEESRPPKATDEGGAPSMCSFEDAVRHTPLGAQRGPDDYRVEAYLTAESSAIYDRLVLKYSDQDVWNDTNIQLEGVEMTDQAGVWVATIPNPVLPAGQSREFHYQICAIDDDSSEEDAILCGPTNLFNSFIAYPPGASGDCVDDTFASMTFDSAFDLAMADGLWAHRRGCGEGAPDYYRMDVQPNQFADVFFTYPFGKQVDVEMYDENRNLLPLDPSMCSGFVYAAINNMETEPLTTYFRVIANDVPYQVGPWYDEVVTNCSDSANEPNDTTAEATDLPTQMEVSGQICTGTDIDVYKVFVGEGEQLNLNLQFTHDAGDLDLAVYEPSDIGNLAGGGEPTDEADSANDNEELVFTARENGDHYVVVFGYENAKNVYGLTATIETPMMGGPCTDDDSFEPNETEATAKSVSFQKHEGLKSCAMGMDWYSLLAFEGEMITVKVDVTSGDASSVGLTVWNEGVPFALGNQNGNTVTATFLSTMSGGYNFSISSTADVTYDLTLNFSI